MSHIFDALQRSEDEQPETETPGLSGATELLRRVERRASSNWEGAARRAGDNTEPNDAAGRRAVGSGPRTTVAAAIEENDSTGFDAAIFSQFQSLPVTVTAQNRLVCMGDDESAAAEAFRLLGVRVRNLRRDRALKKILITSTVPQEGKSMTAANLACTLAQTTQQRILLLEGDLRRPSLSAKFGLGRHPGICECLKGQRTLTSCIYHLKDASLWILPAGSAQSNALELLQSGDLTAIMDSLTKWFDWVIIDSPPVLPLGDTSVWARFSDGILLVTRQGTTEKQHLQRGLDALERKKLIGAVLNCSQSSSDYNYYYRASSDSQSNESPTV
jgi:capsular exopolysaccharide synthesis family protein